MAHHGPDVAVTIAMAPLIERGRAAMTAYELALSPRDRLVLPITVDVVTEADFVASPLLCLHHAVRNGQATHILSPDGTIAALIERFAGKH